MQPLTDLDALLVTTPDNIRYLTGFVSVAPEAREAYLILTKNTWYLCTNALYTEQATELVALRKKRGQTLTVEELTADLPLSKVLLRIARAGKFARIGFEEADLTVAELRKFTQVLTGFTLVPTSKRIETLRMIKKDDELAHIRHACKITDDCFDHTLHLLKPGVSETEIAWEIEMYCRTYGAGVAFSPIVAFGKNSSQPHYQGTSNAKLAHNELILLDFGARVAGYCADMTRVVFVGKAKAAWLNAYAAVLEAQKTALNLLASGERHGAILDNAARRVIAKHKLPVYPHGLGHNVGLAIHELPRLSVKKDETLAPGMVFSVEPGVYKPGQYGIRIEDLVLLNSDGPEILSHSPKGVIHL